MTSGNFSLVPVSQIVVNRDDRQRRELNNIEELAESIRRNGLINPITVTRDHELIAGERRLTAHQLLGFDTIAVQYIDQLDETELHIIELEENIRREELSWQDHVRAVARFHELKATVEPGWTKEKTAEELNVSAGQISRLMLVKSAMDEEVPEVLEAPKLSTAFNFATRRHERRKTMTMRELRADLGSPPAESGDSPAESEGDEPEPVSRRFVAIEQRDFLHWSNEVQDDGFNFIHCDFPYGVSAGDTRGQSGAISWGGYADSPDIYFDLLEAFCMRVDNFTAPSAHLMFWFSMDYYQKTFDALSAAGWRVNPFPLVWYKSDNSGILPDKDRGPRRIYETAFFASRGDRKIVRAVGNATAGGVTKKFHMSEKPTAILEHFFRMIVDETTVMVDPTCGSGNSVKVAEALGASWSLGMDMDPDYVDAAKENLELD